jgi:hypothetical protein
MCERGFSFWENSVQQNFRPLGELNQHLLTDAYMPSLELLFQVVAVIKNDSFHVDVYVYTPKTANC